MPIPISKNKGNELHSPQFCFKIKSIDEYGKCGVEKKNQSFQTCRNILQTNKIEKTAQVITKNAHDHY